MVELEAICRVYGPVGVFRVPDWSAAKDPVRARAVDRLLLGFAPEGMGIFRSG